MALITQGTRVIRRTDGLLTIVPSNIDYELKDGEHDISRNVCEIEISFQLGRVVTAKVTIMPTLDGTFSGVFPRYLMDDEHGTPKEVSEVRFRDGSTLYLTKIP